jgi:hypothetical protein
MAEVVPAVRGGDEIGVGEEELLEGCSWVWSGCRSGAELARWVRCGLDSGGGWPDEVAGHRSRQGSGGGRVWFGCNERERREMNSGRGGSFGFG